MRVQRSAKLPRGEHGKRRSIDESLNLARSNFVAGSPRPSTPHYGTGTNGEHQGEDARERREVEVVAQVLLDHDEEKLWK
jgi:hypothetical protein